MRIGANWLLGIGLWLPLWLGAGVWAEEVRLLQPPVAAAAAPAVRHVLTEQRTVDDEGNLIQPQVAIKEAETDWRDLKHWVRVERKHLEVMLIGSGCSLAVGLALGWLLHWLLRLHFSGPAGFKRRLAQALAGPIVLLLTLFGIFLFMVPVLNALPNAYPHDLRIFLSLVALIAAWAGFHLVELFAGKMRSIAARATNSLNNLMVDLLRKTLKILILVLVMLFIGQSIFNINLSALLAGAGVAGLAIAFAAKDVLANFFGTIVITIDQPFLVGDRIQIGDGNGIVTAVGMRSTRLLTADDSIYTIPNSQFTDQEVQNISRAGVLKYVFTVGLTYDTTPEQMTQGMALLHHILDNFHGPDAPDAAPRIFFSDFGDWAMNLKVIMWLKTADFKVEEEYKSQINCAILTQFNAAGLAMAFPTSTNYVIGVPGSPLPVQCTPPPPSRT